MIIDDATNEPINVCIKCNKEVIGYNESTPFICDECKGDLTGDYYSLNY